MYRHFCDICDAEIPENHCAGHITFEGWADIDDDTRGPPYFRRSDLCSACSDIFQAEYDSLVRKYKEDE